MNWYLAVLKNYTGFNGRARRKEYWLFALFNLIFSFGAIWLDNLAGTAMPDLGYGPIYGIYLLAILIPGLAVSVRRLHDIGKSGWMLLVGIIPIIGALWLLILMCTDSDAGENQYGTNPKTVSTQLA